MLKCSRCRHIFPAERTQRVAPPSPRTSEPASPPARPRGDLDLAFDEAEWEGEEPELEAPRDDEVFSLGTADASPRRPSPAARHEPRLLSDDAPAIEARRSGKTIDPLEEQPTLDLGDYSFDEDGDDDSPAAPTRHARLRGGEPEQDDDDVNEDEDEDIGAHERDDDEDDGPESEEDDVRRGRGWAIPVILFFSVVVACYFLLARELISDRSFAEEFVERLPMVGSSLAADRLLFRKVALSDIEGSFTRVKQGKDVFVISGTALNTASRPLRNIRIEGTVFDSAGRALQQETITCGGMDARRLLQGLSLREVEMLGKVEPSRKFHLDPGETTTFAIVFTNPPSGAADFSARVASAQR